MPIKNIVQTLNIFNKLPRYSSLAPGQLFLFSKQYEAGAVQGLKMVLARRRCDPVDTEVSYVVLSTGYTFSPWYNIEVIPVSPGTEITITAG